MWAPPLPSTIGECCSRWQLGCTSVLDWGLPWECSEIKSMNGIGKDDNSRIKVRVVGSSHHKQMTIVEAARHPGVPLGNDERSNSVQFIAPISQVVRPKRFWMNVYFCLCFIFLPLYFIMYTVWYIRLGICKYVHSVPMYPWFQA
jgi:hypothetical protein